MTSTGAVQSRNDSTTATGPAGRRSAHYRPHLDGLRAVAVYLVVAFHAGVDGFSGGFVGVDVFFVLSGYLVTKLLLRDIDESNRINLRRFYARRYRRLLPAAFVTLAASALIFTVVASASEVADSVSAFRASFLYYANWHFIGRSSDYFAADINNSPVIHFWSLAVEEQFYLLWPLLLGAILSLSRCAGAFRTAFIRAIVAVGAIASVIAALHVASYDLNRAYYGTDTRAYQLLAGAFLALSPWLFSLGSGMQARLRLVGVVALATVVILATSAADLATVDRGIATTVATCVLIIAVENAGAARVTRSLAHPVMAYLGRVSYGTYLWHWPVIVVLTRESSLASVPVMMITCAVATALAATSYHLLEIRVRLSQWLDQYHRRVIGAGLTLSFIGGLVIAPMILRTDPSTVASSNTGDVFSLDWRSAKKDIPPLPTCTSAAPAECTLVHGTGRHLLLLGDSNARMYIPTFEAIADREHLTLSVAAAALCPWQEGLYYLKGVKDCREKQADWYGGLIDSLDPDTIVVVDRPIDDPASAAIVTTSDSLLKPDSPEYESELRDRSAASLAKLRDGGRRVVIVEPIPIVAESADPLNCLSSATTVEACRYNANSARLPLEDFFATLARPGEVWSLDLDRLVCPRLPTCDPVVDGLIVKRDNNHLTGTFAAHISDRVEALLRDAGIIP